MIDPLDDLLGYQLRRASAVMMTDLAKTLEPLALRPTEASVLLAVAANRHATQSAIGRLLSVQRANMAPIAAMLLARGLVERLPGDDRSHRLQLTSDGLAMAGRVNAAIAAHESRFLDDLSQAQRDHLVGQLRRVRNGAANTAHEPAISTDQTG